METVATQIGTSATADFEENTWTFEMPKTFKVRAGVFAIVDKPVYDELLEACKNALRDIQKLNKELISEGKHGYVLMENELNEAIKKATE
jgi:hypothetical protein